MFFTQLDRITQIESRKSLTATKCLSLAEEYLQDHFPGFPVMPGVLMLEALTQAGAWLIRASEDFQHSIVSLREAKNVKYSGFVEPGQLLTLNVEWLKDVDDGGTLLAGKGFVDDKQVVSGRLVMQRSNQADAPLGTSLDNTKSVSEVSEAIDARIKNELRKMYSLLVDGANAVGS